MNIIAESVLDALQKLKEFRSRYSKEEYPRKVAMNVVYILLIIEKLLEKTDYCFPQKGSLLTSNMKHTQFDNAYMEIENMMPQFVQEASSIAEAVFINGSTLMHIDLGKIRDDLNEIEKFDNTRLENLEYTYVYYSTLEYVIQLWLALGLMGDGKHSAFQKVLGSLTNSKFENIINTLSAFQGILRMDVVRDYKPLPNYF